MSDTLYIPLKKLYFDQIKSGTKRREYRLITPYWTKRLVGRDYRRLVLTCGYPAKSDHERRLEMKYVGFYRTQIEHDEFGHGLVNVFCIAADYQLQGKNKGAK